MEHIQLFPDIESYSDAHKKAINGYETFIDRAFKSWYEKLSDSEKAILCDAIYNRNMLLEAKRKLAETLRFSYELEIEAKTRLIENLQAKLNKTS